MKIDLGEHIGSIVGGAIAVVVTLSVGYGLMQATISDVEEDLAVYKVKHDELLKDFNELKEKRSAGVAVVRRVGHEFEQVKTLVLQDLDPRVRTVEMLIRVADDGRYQPYAGQIQHALRTHQAGTSSRPYNH